MAKPKASINLPSPRLEVDQTPDQVRAILWGIASDSEQSGTARVSACRLLLMEARECDDGREAHRDADLNKRALALMRRVASN
jgi:hypothetical protein